ncbi:helix-turn-helix transcriptional regulator [Labrenzia sp. 011]|uniref:helix-turn-helix domain-containing protein n=1 Tax=Labrenzia sp. 011 TaxID=2171494 RepID=UPI000D51D0D7|nr:helix-turn-helix transcriptional regulator [Labrenzia sp. 011]PVB60183.1 XRE family transcriptional regulator [Labrenzia sp. 011]
MSNEAAILETSLGPSLRRWRVLNRIKQEALADDLGVSQSRISRWESGLAQPDGAERLKITRLLRARPETAADRALLDLVTQASVPVHLVCDLTHRLLAISPARAREWHLPVAQFMNRPLWRFASQSIREMEFQLVDRGWFEPLPADIVYGTEPADFPEMFIPESRIRISRLPLSDGSFVRLVREAPRGTEPA